MVDRRPRMRRSRRNATVLLFTCLIQRSDGSHMNSLFLAIGCLGFLYKSSNPLPVICPYAPPLFFLGAAFPAAAAQRGGEVRPSELRLPCRPLLPCLLILPLSWCSARQEEKGVRLRSIEERAVFSRYWK
jgi:hypothetical protein